MPSRHWVIPEREDGVGRSWEEAVVGVQGALLISPQEQLLCLAMYGSPRLAAWPAAGAWAVWRHGTGAQVLEDGNRPNLPPPPPTHPAGSPSLQLPLLAGCLDTAALICSCPEQAAW